MAANALVFYDDFKLQLGNGTQDLDTDSFKVALFTSSYTPAPATDVTYSLLTGEVANANGYTTGGVTLTSVTWTESGGTATFDSADPAWTASGGSITARYAVLYNGTDAANNLIGYVLLDNTPADVTVTDGNTLTIQVAATGWFTLS